MPAFFDRIKYYPRLTPFSTAEGHIGQTLPAVLPSRSALINPVPGFQARLLARDPPLHAQAFIMG
jgi:hypothetical protein